MSDQILPPRKKDWKPGNVQIGLFIRNKDGGKVEIAVHDASDEERSQAILLLLELVKPRKVESAAPSDASKQPQQ